ncbi:MAG: fibronectin type III domain-containing protein, partial [Bacteroidota bacterium]|nr:fibronectin type III domain-containing protein [Bacteroidota bacterium]
YPYIICHAWCKPGDQDNISAIQYQVTGLTPGMTYYVRVRGKALDGSYSLFSSIQWFTVSPGSYSVAVPITGNPSGDVEITSANALLSWYTPSAQSSGQKYDLEYSTKEDFKDAIRVNGIDSMSYMLSDLKGNTKYFWRVRSMTNDGKISQYSTEGIFVTSKYGVIQKDNLIPKNYLLSQNYPNPFNPSTTIEFSVPKNEMVSFTVYDILGKVVRVVLNEELSAGNYKVSFSGEEFSSGVYIYRLSTPSVSMTKKMIMQK